VSDSSDSNQGHGHLKTQRSYLNDPNFSGSTKGMGGYGTYSVGWTGIPKQ